MPPVAPPAEGEGDDFLVGWWDPVGDVRRVVEDALHLISSAVDEVKGSIESQFKKVVAPITGKIEDIARVAQRQLDAVNLIGHGDFVRSTRSGSWAWAAALARPWPMVS